jgi:transposase-like protein
MTAGHGGKRPRQAEAAIAALLTEPTVEAAAQRVGINESTLLRWLKEPEFGKEYRTARRLVVEGAVGRLQQTATEAVDALARNLTCGIPAVEVGAAKAVLDQAMKGMELLDLAERVAALEQTAEAESGRSRSR